MTSRIEKLELGRKAKPKVIIKSLNWEPTPQELSALPAGTLIVKMWQPGPGLRKEG